MATPALVPDASQSNISGPQIVPIPRPKSPRLGIHVLLFVVTLLSTTMVGMRYMYNFRLGHFPLASDADIFPFDWVWANRAHFTSGLPFSLTLLLILLTHEFGHYFACRYYGVKATLPYLLPAPSLSGTAGAVIRLRSRIKSRRALLTIGGMGPLAGFVVALGCCMAGLAMSRTVAADPLHLVVLERPLLLRLSLLLFHKDAAAPLLWHPVLVASWIGILITSLNLIPAGQLDGGHIVYALSPRVHRVVTNVTLLALVVLGITCWLGWLLWCALLLVPGMRHPNVESTDELRPVHKLLAASGLVMFVLCATPKPFSDSSLLAILHRWPWLVSFVHHSPLLTSIARHLHR